MRKLSSSSRTRTAARTQEVLSHQQPLQRAFPPAAAGLVPA